VDNIRASRQVLSRIWVVPRAGFFFWGRADAVIRSIAKSRSGHLSSSVPEVWPKVQIRAARRTRLPIADAIEPTHKPHVPFFP